MAQVYTFTSGRGGTGKSALAAEMAVLLSRTEKVLVMDLSVGMRSLDQFLGYEDRVVYDIMDISDGRVKSRHVILDRGEESWPALIPASQTRGLEELDPARIGQLVRQLRDRFDRILIDVPSGSNTAWETACAVSDRILIVETPDASGIRGIDRIRTLTAERFPAAELSLILNRCVPGAASAGWQSSPDEICELTGLTLTGMIPEDQKLAAGIVTGAPELPAGLPAVQALNNTIRRLNGEELAFPDLSLPLRDPGSGFLHRLFGGR